MNRGPGVGAPPNVIGAVLAGGLSSRMGREKAALAVGEHSMLEAAVAALLGSTRIDEVFVVSSRQDTPTGPWRVVPDLRSSAGPLAGIETALVHGRDRSADAVFVLACDLPHMESEVIDDVLGALVSGAAAAAARSGSPGFEPLCAVYRTDCLARASALLDDGERAAWRLFHAVEGTTVAVNPERLANVNTPEELESARERRRG